MVIAKLLVIFISLTVTPTDVEAVAPTGTAQFSVIGTFDKAPITVANVAAQWTTSDSAVATVTANGSATCLAVGGPITVTASGKGHRDSKRLGFIVQQRAMRHGDIRVTMNYGDAVGEGLREASAKVAAKAIPQ